MSNCEIALNDQIDNCEKKVEQLEEDNAKLNNVYQALIETETNRANVKKINNANENVREMEPNNKKQMLGRYIPIW